MLVACAFASPALASEPLTDFNPTFRSLAVNSKGEALVTYTRSNGQVRHVLAWGAINAQRAGRPGVRQVRFKCDYAGGWGKYRKREVLEDVQERLRAVRRPGARRTSSPPARRRTAPTGRCSRGSGSLPLLGFDPWLPAQTQFELHVSHWSGELPKLEVYTHWTYGGEWQGALRAAHLPRQPVHGFGSTGRREPAATATAATSTSTPSTRPTAPAGGASRGSSSHKPTGTFCHSFVPQKPFPGYPSQAMRPPAPGERYRITVMGPGVTPVVQWEGLGLTAADRASAASITAVFDQLMAGDARCAAER